MDGNMDKKIADTRDIWMEMEATLLDELLALNDNDLNKQEYTTSKVIHIKENRALFEVYKERPAQELYDKAIRLIELIESNKPMQEFEIKKTIEQITLLFAAIVDAEKGPLVKEKTWDGEEEQPKIDYAKQVMDKIREIPIERRKAILETEGKDNIMQFIKKILEYDRALKLQGAKSDSTSVREDISETESPQVEESLKDKKQITRKDGGIER